MKNIKIFIIIISIFTLTGCNYETSGNTEDKIDKETIEISYTSKGNTIFQEIPLDPEKVVVIGDTGIETLIHFDMADTIIGVAYLNNSFSKYEDKIKSLPLINSSWASKEAILSLEPELIISIDSALEEERCGTIEYWNKKGIPVICYSDFSKGMSIENFKNDVTNIMAPFSKSKEKELVEYFKNWIDSYEKASNLPDVLFLSISPNGFYYFAPSWCLISEIIEDLGGEYIILSDQLYIEVSTEALLKTNPTNIIITEHLNSNYDDVKAHLYNHPILKELDAVKNNQVLAVNYTASIQGNFDIPILYSEISNLLKESSNE